MIDKTKEIMKLNGEKVEPQAIGGINDPENLDKLKIAIGLHLEKIGSAWACVHVQDAGGPVTFLVLNGKEIIGDPRAIVPDISDAVLKAAKHMVNVSERPNDSKAVH